MDGRPLAEPLRQASKTVQALTKQVKVNDQLIVIGYLYRERPYNQWAS